mgnify:FL=1
MTLYPKRGWRASILAIGVALSGAAAAFAWQGELWGLLTGAALTTIWLTGLAWWNAARVPPLRPRETDRISQEDSALMHRLLLDAAPTPLVAIDGDTARVLNRAARTVFGTDDRILPPVQALSDPVADRLHHEGRQWRIDRVAAPGGTTVAALIDVEREEHAAETRASEELIEILGHEMLNGLAPVVSLAESATHALRADPLDKALLEEILGPLARRTEGLHRFASAYRDLARLPEPRLARVSLGQFASDCDRVFTERWPHVALTLAIGKTRDWPMDRDQMHQAVWALLSNAAHAACEADDPAVGLAFACVGRRLEITVTDNGVGIAPDRAVLIFRPFHTTKPGGSGVGLALARRIARNHGGTVELVAAQPTTFRLSLPTDRGAQAELLAHRRQLS